MPSVMPRTIAKITSASTLTAAKTVIAGPPRLVSARSKRPLSVRASPAISTTLAASGSYSASARLRYMIPSVNTITNCVSARQ